MLFENHVIIKLMLTDTPPAKQNALKTIASYFRSHKIRLLVVFIVAVGAVAAAWIAGSKNEAATLIDNDVALTDSAAIQAGKRLSGGKCEGSGPVELSALPMKLDDFAMIIPYGLVVGGHVTPIDHQYFSPADPNSAADTYPVYALADGRVTNISHRGATVGNVGKPSNDYRFVFSHSCTFLTYFDLVTSLAPDIKEEYDKVAKVNGTNSQAELNMEVKAGQLVGFIGGQTLDFAVWDTTKPLPGFISPELYEGEAWKIYTADPLDYYTEPVKQQILSKYLRTTPPPSGKIDYDQDGRLVGNWFAEGTNGYEGDRQQADGKYWRGHLSFAPDHLDPTAYVASFGTYAEPGDGKQFMIVPGSLLPDVLGVDSGLVKYQLQSYSYLLADGTAWDRRTHTVDPKMVANTSQGGGGGCVLVQMLESRRLRAEPFPESNCASVSGFTDGATTYIR